MGRSIWQRRWPELMLLLGVLAWLPVDRVCWAVERLEEALLCLRWLEPPHGFGRPAPAELASSLDERFAAELRECQTELFPPAGWEGDGEFHAVPLKPERSFEQLLADLPGALPADEPAVLGQARLGGRERTVLVGFSRADRGGRTWIEPITATDHRLPAWAGDPGGTRQLRFVAEGDGSGRLRITSLQVFDGLQDGDLVWVDPEVSARLWPGTWQPPRNDLLCLGTVVTDLSAFEPHKALRVDPPWSLSLLGELALRYPPGFPAPAELRIRPLVVPVLESSGQRLAGRSGLLIAAGREAGLVPGTPLVKSGWLAGRVHRAGWWRSAVERVEDAGFRCSVRLLRKEDVLPFELVVSGVEDGRCRLASGPPPEDASGTVLVTALSSDAMPAALALGTLERDARGWYLERSELPDGELVALVNEASREGAR